MMRPASPLLAVMMFVFLSVADARRLRKSLNLPCDLDCDWCTRDQGASLPPSVLMWCISASPQALHPGHGLPEAVTARADLHTLTRVSTSIRLMGVSLAQKYSEDRRNNDFCASKTPTTVTWSVTWFAALLFSLISRCMFAVCGSMVILLKYFRLHTLLEGTIEGPLSAESVCCISKEQRVLSVLKCLPPPGTWRWSGRCGGEMLAASLQSGWSGLTAGSPCRTTAATAGSTCCSTLRASYR